MAHYAFLDENNIVTSVITGRNEDEVVDGISNWEEYYGNFEGKNCKRTSYNTVNGIHIKEGTPFRGNFAEVGMYFDESINPDGEFIYKDLDIND